MQLRSHVWANLVFAQTVDGRKSAVGSRLIRILALIEIGLVDGRGEPCVRPLNKQENYSLPPESTVRPSTKSVTLFKKKFHSSRFLNETLSLEH